MTKAKLPERRRQWSLLPEFSELFTGFPGWSDLRPTLENRLMRLEDEMEDGHYVVRAEIPESTRPRTSKSACATAG